MHRISDNEKPLVVPARLWLQLRSRNPILAWTAFFHAALFLIALGLFMVDTREVMGINPWIKPMKFMASISIYLVTIAWLMGHIERPRWAVQLIAWGIASCMIAETAVIFMQAGRGVRSHFNMMTPFDAGVFSIMGLGVIIDFLLMALMLLLFFRRDVKLAPSHLWGIRIGIVMFLLGGIVGGWMSSQGGHTVGSQDGGPGLPFLNWSMTGGDLRIGHALGLHGLQVMPILGYLITKRRNSEKWSLVPVWALKTFGALYGTMFLITLLQASQGRAITSLWG
jgi:hypothetical protein